MRFIRHCANVDQYLILSFNARRVLAPGIGVNFPTVHAQLSEALGDLRLPWAGLYSYAVRLMALGQMLDRPNFTLQLAGCSYDEHWGLIEKYAEPVLARLTTVEDFVGCYESRYTGLACYNETLMSLAAAYLALGRPEEAKQVVARLRSDPDRQAMAAYVSRFRRT